MNITYLQHGEIDKVAWDDCIENAENSLLYAISWYLDVVSPQWEAVVGATGSQYCVCFPIPVRKKLGLKYVYQPLFCQQLGLFYRRPLSQELVNQVLKKFLQELSYVPKLSFNVGNTFSFVMSPRIRLQTRITHLLPLDKPYHQLRSKYHRDRRYRINRVMRLNLPVVASDDIEPLIEIFLKNTAHRIAGAEDDRNYSLFRNVFKAVKENGQYELYYTCDKEGNYTSGCWFAFYKNAIIYLFNAATDEARNENGRSFIIDHIIQKYQNTDYILDFESPVKDSISSFYASFGSTPTPFYQIYYNRLPIVFRQLHWVKIKAHRRLLRWIYPNRKLPDIQRP